MREFSETPADKPETEELAEEEEFEEDLDLPTPFAGIAPIDPITEFLSYFRRPPPRSDTPPEGRGGA
jgi:hypothetical protein